MPHTVGSQPIVSAG